jgi:hypothetical protein
MVQFVVGAIAGGLAMWLWGEDVRRYANTGARSARMKAAETIQAVEHAAGEVFDTAKQQVHSTLQAGQDAVRPKIV